MLVNMTSLRGGKKKEKPRARAASGRRGFIAAAVQYKNTSYVVLSGELQYHGNKLPSLLPSMTGCNQESSCHGNPVPAPCSLFPAAPTALFLGCSKFGSSSHRGVTLDSGNKYVIAASFCVASIAARPPKRGCTQLTRCVRALASLLPAVLPAATWYMIV